MAGVYVAGQHALWGHAWQGPPLQGVCVAGGMHGRVACKLGGMHARGHAWWGHALQGGMRGGMQGGMQGWGHVWWGA